MQLKEQRRCVVCRRLGHKSEFRRIVRNFPDHHITLEKGMGRSVYLCPTMTCLKAAEKKDRLSRSLKATVPSEIYQRLQQALQPQPPIPKSPTPVGSAHFLQKMPK